MGGMELHVLSSLVIFLRTIKLGNQDKFGKTAKIHPRYWETANRVTSILRVQLILTLKNSFDMDLVAQKPLFRVCDQVRFKPACKAKEACLNIESLCVSESLYFLESE